MSGSPSRCQRFTRIVQVFASMASRPEAIVLGEHTSRKRRSEPPPRAVATAPPKSGLVRPHEDTSPLSSRGSRPEGSADSVFRATTAHAVPGRCAAGVLAMLGLWNLPAQGVTLIVQVFS